MAYIDEILEPGEKVVFKTRLSWTLYGPAIVYALVALALTVFATSAAGLGVMPAVPRQTFTVDGLIDLFAHEADDFAAANQFQVALIDLLDAPAVAV